MNSIRSEQGAVVQTSSERLNLNTGHSMTIVTNSGNSICPVRSESYVSIACRSSGEHKECVTHGWHLRDFQHDLVVRAATSLVRIQPLEDVTKLLGIEPARFVGIGTEEQFLKSGDLGPCIRRKGRELQAHLLEEAGKGCFNRHPGLSSVRNYDANPGLLTEGSTIQLIFGMKREWVLL